LTLGSTSWTVGRDLEVVRRRKSVIDGGCYAVNGTGKRKRKGERVVWRSGVVDDAKVECGNEPILMLIPNKRQTVAPLL
jgi:hypothetical protein